MFWKDQSRHYILLSNIAFNDYVGNDSEFSFGLIELSSKAKYHSLAFMFLKFMWPAHFVGKEQFELKEISVVFMKCSKAF